MSFFLKDCGLQDGDGQALARAISAKAFPHLEVLSLSVNYTMGEGWVSIMKALEGGGCTDLKALDLSQNNMSSTTVTAVIRALSSGHCRQLEELYIDNAFKDPIPFFQSIKSLRFTHMRRLDIIHASHNTNEEQFILLGEALKAGAFPKLDILHFSEHSIHHSLWEALEAGSCPEMREFEFESVGFDNDSSVALASAIASGSLSKLQSFQITEYGDDEDASLVEVLNAMASFCPDLRKLDLSSGFIVPTRR